MEQKKEKTESERKFASGWTNEKSVSIDEDKRKEDKKPDEPVKKDENKENEDTSISGLLGEHKETIPIINGGSSGSRRNGPALLK